MNWGRRFHMNVGEKSSHLGELTRLTGPARLHINSPLIDCVNIWKKVRRCQAAILVLNWVKHNFSLWASLRSIFHWNKNKSFVSYFSQLSGFYIHVWKPVNWLKYETLKILLMSRSLVGLTWFQGNLLQECEHSFV